MQPSFQPRQPSWASVVAQEAEHLGFWVLITPRATLLVTVSYPVMSTGWQGNAIIQYTNIQVVRLRHLSGGKKAHFASHKLFIFSMKECIHLAADGAPLVMIVLGLPPS